MQPSALVLLAASSLVVTGLATSTFARARARLPSPPRRDESECQEVRDLIEALPIDPTDHGAVRALVLRRHREGWRLEEVLHELESVHRRSPRAVRRSVDWVGMWGTAGICWADATEDSLLAAGARDAVTGLPSASFLAVVLEDLVESADDTEHTLVNARARPHRPGLEEHLAVSLTVSGAMRRSVPPPVTVACVAAGHAVAVVPPLLDASSVLETVEAHLARLTPTAEVETWSTPRPRTLRALRELTASWH